MRGRRQGQAVGQGPVGSITHGLKIKKPLEVFTGPRMVVNPPALAPGQNALCLPSPILSTGGQAWLPPSLPPREPGARTSKEADTRVVQRLGVWWSAELCGDQRTAISPVGLAGCAAPKSPIH